MSNVNKIDLQNWPTFERRVVRVATEEELLVGGATVDPQPEDKYSYSESHEYTITGLRAITREPGGKVECQKHCSKAAHKRFNKQISLGATHSTTGVEHLIWIKSGRLEDEKVQRSDEAKDNRGEETWTDFAVVQILSEGQCTLEDATSNYSWIADKNLKV